MLFNFDEHEFQSEFQKKTSCLSQNKKNKKQEKIGKKFFLGVFFWKKWEKMEFFWGKIGKFSVVE